VAPVESEFTSILSFVGGIASLHDQLGDVMGDPVEGQHLDGDDCNVQQLTTTGLAYWRCASAIPGFVAFPDGVHHWALVNDQLVEWDGPTAEPPSLEAGLAPDSPPTALEAIPPANCLDVSVDSAAGCMLTDGASILGYLNSPGGTNSYRLDVGQPQAEAILQLTDLPADYDLYLADASGLLLGQSVQEETTPEMIDMWLPGGTYFVYVHVDPGRDFDTEAPYRLNLSINTAVAAGP
jgi:hypothetical protein